MRRVSGEQILQVLLTAPKGLRAPEVMRQLTRRVSQPTLWRILDKLQSEGLVVVDGYARATRYHAAQRGNLATLRSLRMHEVVARRLIKDRHLLEVVRSRLARLRKVNPHGGLYHDRWQELIDGPMDRLVRTMVEPSEDSNSLRQESPFTTLVPDHERRRVFASVRSFAVP